MKASDECADIPLFDRVESLQAVCQNRSNDMLIGRTGAGGGRALRYS